MNVVALEYQESSLWTDLASVKNLQKVYISNIIILLTNT